MKKFLTFILVVLIIAAIGLGAWYFYTNQQNANDEIASLKNEINELKDNKDSNSEELNTTNTGTSNQNTNSQNTNNTTTSNTVTVSNIIGGYDNGGGEGNYQSICVYENGTFAYYPSGEVDSHYEGYYVINGNKVTFYSIMLCGNDPAATVKRDIFEATVNNGSITFNNIVMSKSTNVQTRYDNGNENGGIDLSNSISSRLKSNYLISE